MNTRLALTLRFVRATRRAASSSLLCTALCSFVPGCGGAPGPGQPIRCGTETRVALDCASEIQYQGVQSSGGVDILNVGKASVRYEEPAIREVNAELGRYVALQTRLCRDYNACVLSAAEYKAQAERTRETFKTAAALAAEVSSADPETRNRAINKLYAGVVPDSARPEQLTIDMRLDAEIPASAGGGVVLLQPGGSLPTNARIAFSFSPSKAAHLYVYQVSPSAEVTVLFPNAGIPGLSNPIAGGRATRIPPGEQRFRLNERDLGVEKVYFLASVAPLDSMDKALRAATEKAVRVGDDPTLARVGTGKPDPSSPCTRGLELETCGGERGLELEPAKDVTARARTEIGDEVIIQVLPFEHVTEQDYATRTKAPSSGGGARP